MSEQSKNFWAGVRAEIPLLIGVFPFGMIYGALALNAGLSNLASQMMSSLVFAGSAAAVSAWLTYKACLLIGALEKRITRLEMLAERRK